MRTDGDNDDGQAFLTVDAPCNYREAMGRKDANGWVEAITEEYEVLKRKGVFIEVEPPPDVHIHDG